VEAIRYLTRLLQNVSQDSVWLAFVRQSSAQPVFYPHRQFEQMIHQNQRDAVIYLQKAGILKNAASGSSKSQKKIAFLLAGLFFLVLGLTYFLKREWLTGDTVIAGFLLFFSVFLYSMTWNFPAGKLSATVGPASMPRLWIFGLWIFCSWLIVDTIRGNARPDNQRQGDVTVPLKLLGMMVVYLLLIRYAGYAISTFLFLTAGATVLNYRKHAVIFVTVVGFVIFSYLIFYKILQVPLPRGLWLE
jgi:hypothetical protein